jgi:hypothetical protein
MIIPKHCPHTNTQTPRTPRPTAGIENGLGNMDALVGFLLSDSGFLLSDSFYGRDPDPGLHFPIH